MLILTGNEDNCRDLAARLHARPDFCHEIRADLLKAQDEELFQLIAARKNVIFTYKEPAEALYERAVKAGAHYVDMDYSWPRPLLAHFAAAGECELIVSAHLFTYAPEKWASLWAALQECPARILKLAVMVEDAAEVAELCRLVRDSANKRPVILVAMGAAGRLSRLLPGICGSYATYVAAAATKLTAPGQLTWPEWSAYRRPPKGRGFFALLGGAQIAHSPGPAFYNKYFPYFPIVTSNLEKLLPWLEEAGLLAASITMPNKLAAYRLCDWLTAAAVAAGAVNTIYFQDGRWCGDNTDYLAMRKLTAQLALADCEVTVLGAGGAARAVTAALTAGGARVTCYSRRRSAWCGSWRPWSELGEARGRALINATPLGFNGEQLPLAVTCFEQIIDLVLAERSTPLLTEAAAAGRQIVSGRDFWQLQADLQLELFRRLASANGGV